MEGKTVSYHCRLHDPPSFPKISDYDGLEQHNDGHKTLEPNLNVSGLLLS